MKKQKYILMIMMMLVMCGCGSFKQDHAEGGTVPEMQEEPQTENSGEFVVNEEFWNVDRYSATVIEDAEFIYFCGKEDILKIDKDTLEAEKIWTNAKSSEVSKADTYYGGKGIYAANRIYFIEEWTEEADSLPMRALSVVDTSGKNYERIEIIPSEKEARLVLLNGILYFATQENSTGMEGYPFSKKGTLLKDEKVVTEISNIPAEYMEAYYYKNGSCVLSALESEKRYGYYLLRDEDYNLCRIDPQNGQEEKFPDVLNSYSLASLNDKDYLFLDYTDNRLYLADTQTLEYRFLADSGEYCDVITMDDQYVYYQNALLGDDFTQYQYRRVELATGESEELFTIDAYVGTTASSPGYLMDVSILDQYIYYVGEQDYKLYLMRRDIEMPGAVEVLGDAIYDSGISEVGTLQTYKEKIYSKKDPEYVTGELDLEWLVVDNRFAGAETINQLLEEEQQSNIVYLQENAKEYDTWDDFNIPGYSFSSNISPIYYMDGRYLSFVQQNYDYAGGAHGMPYWIGYTFDLETGNELMLSDIVADDDTTVKELITRYFTKMYEEQPDMYWDNAVDVVKEGASLQSPFYLNEEGIVFYYGPYELAPYAGGFHEVVVPYSEFDLKINLQQDLGER